MTIRQHLDRLPFEIKDRLMTLRETQLSDPKLVEEYPPEDLDGNPVGQFVDDLYDAIREALVFQKLSEEELSYWKFLGFKDSPLLEIGKYYQSIAGRVFLITERDHQGNFYKIVSGQCVQNGELKCWSHFGEEGDFTTELEPETQLILRPVEAPAPPVTYTWVKPEPRNRALILD